MATTAPDIQAHASLPRVVAFGPELNLDPSNWHWVHGLTFPLETLNRLQFSQSPYKWIRYAVGVVIGAKGDLSFSSDSPDVMDYNAGLPAEPTVLYYHVTDEERQRMFPVDPNIRRTNTTSSVATSRKAQFSDDVAERDGRACVLSRIEETLCDAVHLLPRSKGDAYISTYTQRRSRDPTGCDIVQDIDSVRNGLFLNKFTRTALSKDVAFLRTPNFAMNTTDIDPSAPPTEGRCTTHLFQPDKPLFLGRETLPLGSPLQMADTPEWPPDILFDAVYSSAVLNHFATQTLMDEVAEKWKDTYPGGVMTVADERTDAAERRQNQTQERKARHEARTGPDTFDVLMALPYALVPPDELNAAFREAKEKAEAAEQRRVREKVETWVEQVAST